MTNSENDDIIRVMKAFERNVSRIEWCLEVGFKEESIILIVSTFEAFLRDLLVLKKSRWFYHTQKGIIPRMMSTETRKIIHKYLRDIRAYNEFLKMRYIYSGDSNNPDITSLYEVLIGQGKINFQNLTKENGVRVAYKTFFNIDLVKSLDENNSTSDRRWEELNKLFDERHEIVHRSKATTFSEEDIRKVLDSIKYLMKYSIYKLGPYTKSEGGLIYYFKEDFEKPSKNVENQPKNI
ncbi:MAG TPA: HEPN domain-containing protein [Desulfosporosinus sp.]|nr:HEPN domain-containing protein [Desulfosporosinus sp.]